MNRVEHGWCFCGLGIAMSSGKRAASREKLHT